MATSSSTPTAGRNSLSSPLPHAAARAPGSRNHSGGGGTTRGIAASTGDMENSESNNTIVTAHTDLLLTPTSAVGIMAAQQQQHHHHHQHHLQHPAGNNMLPVDDGGERGLRDSAPRLNTEGSAEAPAEHKRRRSSARSLHRLVEQDEREPLCVIIFKWTLIVVGAAMLGVVIFIMGDVIYSWATDTLEHQLLKKQFLEQQLSEQKKRLEELAAGKDNLTKPNMDNEQ